jgi:hypothetical protein
MRTLIDQLNRTRSYCNFQRIIPESNSLLAIGGAILLMNASRTSGRCVEMHRFYFLRDPAALLAFFLLQLNDQALGKNDMSILTIPFVLAFEQSFASQTQYEYRAGLRGMGATMWRLRNTVRDIELGGKTLCFIVFLILSGEACLYYAVRMLLSEL